MSQLANIRLKFGWVSLAIISLAILVFGVIATAAPISDLYLRADGVASTGLGLFGF